MYIVPDILTHERAVIFADYQQTLDALRREGRQIDLAALRAYLAEGRHVLEAFVYIATHPLAEHYPADQATLHRLRQHGFLVHSRAGQLLPDGRLGCDFNLELALDVQEFVARTRPDIVVLVTGDGDLVPLVERLRLHGVRVEVASTPAGVSAALRAMANGFVDLTRLGQAVDNLPLPRDLPLPAEVEACPAPGEAAPLPAAGCAARP
jgi:uncharacterized LabA/DUF88 family protein